MNTNRLMPPTAYLLLLALRVDPQPLSSLSASATAESYADPSNREGGIRPVLTRPIVALTHSSLGRVGQIRYANLLATTVGNTQSPVVLTALRKSRHESSAHASLNVSLVVCHVGGSQKDNIPYHNFAKDISILERHHGIPGRPFYVSSELDSISGK